MIGLCSHIERSEPGKLEEEMHIPFAYLVGVPAIMLGAVLLIGGIIRLFEPRKSPDKGATD